MEKSAIKKAEKFLLLLLKYILSFFLGFLTSKIGIKSDISPFSISILSISPFTNLSPISQFIGIFLGYITKDFSINNYKYICSNIIMLSIIYLSGKKYYKKIFSSFLSATVCFCVGFIFLFAEDFCIVSFLLLICESVICGCATYFIKYTFNSFNSKKHLKSKDIISLNITIIILLCALDNYYLFSTPLSLVFIIFLIYLCCYFFDRKTALLFTSTICAIPAVLHPGNSFYFVLLYVPAVVSIIISKFEKKHIVTSFVLSFMSIYTMNFQNISFGTVFSPLYAAIVYIIVPKKKLTTVLSNFISVYDPITNKDSFDDLCKEYNQASLELLNKIESATINPILNNAKENKLKKYLISKNCENIDISNFYNENGKQIVTIRCASPEKLLVNNLKNKINELCNNSFEIYKEETDKNNYYFRFEQTDEYKIECFALYKAKHGETICGDNVTAFKCQNGYFYLIIADGMGSGKNAYNKSINTISIIKKLLKSGAEVAHTIDIANSAMDIIKDGVGFSTADICKISLKNVQAEFIKCGATNSYVLRNKKLINIKGGGFPIGLDNNVYYLKENFNLYDGDIIVMTSDGISLSEALIQSVVLLQENNSIEYIAKSIIDASFKETKNNDDMSVLVASVKKNYIE